SRPQDLPDLLRLEQARDTDEVLLLEASGLGAEAELGPLVEHPVEVRLRFECLEIELVEVVCRGGLRAVRFCDEFVVERKQQVAAIAIERVVPLEFHLAGEGEN